MLVASTRERIDRWLGELLATGIEGDGVTIALVHAAVDQGQRAVKTWKLGEAVEACDALVGEIDETAEADAEALGGRQRYVLRAHLKGRDVGSLTLRYEAMDSGQAVDSEPANATGAMALLQRHADGAMRLMVSSFGGVLDSYRQQIAAQQALIQEYQRQAAESFRLQEALASKKLEQKLVLEERRAQLQLTAAREMAEIEKSEVVWKKGMAQVFELAPVILHYLTGGKAGEDPDDWRERQARAAAEEMFARASDEDIEQWRRAMPPEQFEAVMERVRAHRGQSAATPAPSAARNDDEPRLRQPRQDLAGIAERLYGSLCAHVGEISGLANGFLAQRPLEKLDPEARAALDAVTHALSGHAPELGPAPLWCALLATPVAGLLPVIEAVNAGKPWREVPAEVKLQLMRVLQEALRIAQEGG
jgi:hypothetical protein